MGVQTSTEYMIKRIPELAEMLSLPEEYYVNMWTELVRAQLCKEGKRSVTYINDNADKFVVLSNSEIVNILFNVTRTRSQLFDSTIGTDFPEQAEVLSVGNKFGALVSYICAQVGGASKKEYCSADIIVCFSQGAPQVQEVPAEPEIDFEDDDDPTAQIEFDDVDLDEDTEPEESAPEESTTKEESTTEPEPEEDADDLDETMVNSIVGSIMLVYESMYAPLFECRPDGVMTAEGIVTVDKDGDMRLIKKGSIYAVRVYEDIVGMTKGTLVAEDFRKELSLNFFNADGTARMNYCPSLQIRNISGVYRNKEGKISVERSWDKFREKLRVSTQNNVIRILKKFDTPDKKMRAQQSIVEIFTTCFIAEKLDITTSARLTFKSEAVANTVGYEALTNGLIRLNSFNVDKSMIQVIDNNTYGCGVHRALIIFDKTRYNGEILFAYKAIRGVLEGGGTISAKRALIGRDIAGGNVALNFEDQSNVVTLIVGQSGCGKGVVTLNILANFIASGLPFCYTDWKPDMSAMLWDLERKTGSRILSVDGLAGVDIKRDGSEVRPVRNYGTGINIPRITGISNMMNVMAYAKMMLLGCLMAEARRVRYMGLTSFGPKMMFIFDEAEIMNQSLRELFATCEAYMSDSSNKPKKNEEPSDEFKYVKRVRDTIKSLETAVVQLTKAGGRVGNVGFVLLGQTTDPDGWAGGRMRADTIGRLVSGCKIKMIGSGSINNNKYSLADAIDSVKGKEFLNSPGYFAIIPDSLATKAMADKIEVAKTYLVLNENDYNENESQMGRCTAGIASRVNSPDVWELVVQDLTEGGGINPLVGFPGLIEYIGNSMGDFDMNSNLESGYVHMETLLSGLGILQRYSCIEEFVFDCSMESLLTWDELSQAVRDGTTVYEAMGIDAPVKEGDSAFGEEDLGLGAVTEVDEEIPGFGDFKAPVPVKETLPVQERTPEPGGNKIPFVRNPNRTPIVPQGGDEMLNPSFNREVSRVMEEQRRRPAAPPVQEEDFYQDAEPEYYDDEQLDFDFSPVEETGRAPMYDSSEGRVTLDDRDRHDVKYMKPEEYFEGGIGKRETPERFRSTLFQSLRGTKYEFNSRWKAVLDSVARRIRPNLITRVMLINEEFYVNGRSVYMDNVLGGFENIRLEDIVSLEKLFERFKNIREIMVDEAVLERVMMEKTYLKRGFFGYGRDLQKFAVMDRNERVSVFTRAAAMDAKEQEELSAKAERSKQRTAVSAVCAEKYKGKGNPGEVNKVWQATRNMTSGSFKNIKANMSKNKLVASAAWGVAGLAVMGIGGVLSAVTGLLGMIRR